MRRHWNLLITIIVFAVVPALRAGDAAASASRAYSLLRARQYDAAVAAFQDALSGQPDHVAWRQDLAYTYLKIGESVLARDEFAAVARLQPGNTQAALEHAFLCYETRQPVAARRAFGWLRESATGLARETAALAFENIDRPLRDGIARWRAAVASTPSEASGHEELARLADERDDWALAASHYEKAWLLRPSRRQLLLDLGRVWSEVKDARAVAALLAAARGGEPRVAESAREQLPSRYPFVYEFEQALALDPANVPLRREFAYLLLQMERREPAEREFARLVELAPDDLVAVAQLGFLRWERGDQAAARPLLQRALESGTPELANRIRVMLKLPVDPAASTPPKLKTRTESTAADDAALLATNSEKAGYWRDATRYLRMLHEANPADYDVVLRLGWAHNMMHADREALQWFALARNSPDGRQAAEADKAYRNLAPAFRAVRLTAWFFPLYSSRWHDLFSYGQAKAELRLGNSRVRPYLSVRLAGDLRALAVPGQAANLSESAFVVALGAAATVGRGVTVWGESGWSLPYLRHEDGRRPIAPDHRGGVSLARGWGHLLGGTSRGSFAEANADGVFLSRFGDDLIVSLQARAGWTLPTQTVQAQLLWHWNATTDLRRQYWANTVETGPGVRWRWKGLPPPVSLSLSALRGAHLRNEGNPRRPNYWDVRAGVWYAFTH